MIFPLEQLVKFSENIYEATVASSRRAYQMAMIKDKAIEENEDKVVSLAAKQVFTKQVKFGRIESKK
ncbi:DNA-directed RNA polymerase subunit omega [Treponema zioleckii]|uniref:DNA-directed RNA polymerase subunit omega n=1 Tax=Treponema zioleckii TaxID=331680 RepID=UPI00168A4146|nr:DNA-directed RNA polymerase subunit omega [Treponema zioleckii]